jgi:hypothetical protein
LVEVREERGSEGKRGRERGAVLRRLGDDGDYKEIERELESIKER